MAASIMITTTASCPHRVDHRFQLAISCLLRFSYLDLSATRSRHRRDVASPFPGLRDAHVEEVEDASMAMLQTRLGGHGGWQERLPDHEPAERCGQLAGRHVDIAKHDRRRDRERPTGNDVHGRAHELDPDRQRAPRARESQRVPIVEADPDEGYEAWRVADEPGIPIGASGLSSGRHRETQYFRHPGSPAVDNATQEMSDHVCLFGRHGGRAALAPRPDDGTQPIGDCAYGRRGRRHSGIRSRAVRTTASRPTCWAVDTAGAFREWASACRTVT